MLALVNLLMALLGIVVAAMVAWFIARNQKQFGDERALIDDNLRAMEILADLTARDAIHARYDTSSTDGADRDYLVALRLRAEAGLNLLDHEERIDQSVRDQLAANITALEGVDTDAVAEVGDRTAAILRIDRSKFHWDGFGAYTKHQILQKLALQHLTDHPSGLAEFQRTFSELVATAVGDRQRDPDVARLLTPLDQADASHRNVAAKVGVLDFDGHGFVVSNTVGYPAADYARRTQIPIIEWFVANGSHVTPAPTAVDSRSNQ